MRHEVETTDGYLAAFLEDTNANVFMLSLRQVELTREDVRTILVAAVLLITAN